MPKYRIEHQGGTYEIEAPEGTDPNALLAQLGVQGGGGQEGLKEGEKGYEAPEYGIGDAALQLGAKAADIAATNPGAIASAATAAGAAYGGNQVRKGLMGIAGRMGQQGGAPAAGGPGPSPSTAGAGTPQQQAASKLATQNLRTQQLHGTLPGNQAPHIGGKAWTVNPSGIITPDAAMEGAPKGGTAGSAPQQAAKKGGMETIRNAAGKVMGKVPMGQAGKLLAKGLARFVPGVGLVMLGADVVEGGMKLYDNVKKGNSSQQDLENVMGVVGAAGGGHIAHMNDGGVMARRFQNIDQINRMMNGQPVQPPQYQLPPSQQRTVQMANELNRTMQGENVRLTQGQPGAQALNIVGDQQRNQDKTRFQEIRSMGSNATIDDLKEAAEILRRNGQPIPPGLQSRLDRGHADGGVVHMQVGGDPALARMLAQQRMQLDRMRQQGEMNNRIMQDQTSGRLSQQQATQAFAGHNDARAAANMNDNLPVYARGPNTQRNQAGWNQVNQAYQGGLTPESQAFLAQEEARRAGRRPPPVQMQNPEDDPEIKAFLKSKGFASGGPVGMMKAQIGNYRAGGRIL